MLLVVHLIEMVLFQWFCWLVPGIEGLPEDFNMSLPCAAEEQQTQQYLQHTAIDRCNSRLSAIYADGTT